MLHYSQELIDRFWLSVSQSILTEEHWLWTAAIGKNGYGILYTKEAGNASSTMYAHRFSYILTKGQAIPQDLLICHKPPCVVRHCVNPFHLYAGTDQDNHNDALSLGRIPRGSQHTGHKIATLSFLDMTENYIAQPGKKRANPGEQNNHAKLKEKQVQEIRRLYATKKLTQSQLAHIFGVEEATIHKIIAYRTWKHIPPYQPPLT